MIAANELRIGNLFYQIDRSNTAHLPITIPMKVLEINMFNVLACLADDNPAMMKTIPVISMSDLSPIPLTPEILEKLGFEFDTITFSKSYFLLAGGDNGFDVFNHVNKIKDQDLVLIDTDYSFYKTEHQDKIAPSFNKSNKLILLTDLCPVNYGFNKPHIVTGKQIGRAHV